MKLVIVGGVAGGASAAARARRLSETAEIVLLERGPDVSFANCGLPYYIGGEIQDRKKLLVTTPELLRERFRLDVRTRSNVVSIDRTAKTVRVQRLDDGTAYDEPYDALILAPGAAPLKPPIPGIDLPGITTLRNLEDTDRIHAKVTSGIDSAAIIGAGFIGLEMAENLVRRGIRTTLVELQPQVLPPLDPEMAEAVSRRLRDHGVELILGQSAQAFEPAADGRVRVKLSGGATLDAGLVVLGIGVRPENALARAAGLPIGPRGGIQVDDHMRTADPHIFAVGDAVEIRNTITGEPAQVPLAGPANRQGRIAADNVFGRPSRYRGTQGTAIVGVFGLAAAMTGLTEKTLRAANRPYHKLYIHPNQHAGYYPGAQAMTLKLLVEPGDGKLLGAQAVGADGVDKRIDVLATAIQAGFTVFDLEEAELAYAPQFGSAKDPINMAGFVGSAVVRGDYPQVYAENLADTLAQTHAFLLDVRTPREFAAGAIPDSVNIPIDSLRDRLHEIPRDRPLIVTCQAGLRGYVATRLLRNLDFDASNLAGGYLAYRMAFPSSP